MKKIFGIVFTIVLLASTAITPVTAAVTPIEVADPTVPEVPEPVRHEPELLPQEILDEFEDGMTIEEFLIKNEGPIPNALIEYADMPVTIVVQLDSPSLIEYVNSQGVSRESNIDTQLDYVAKLKSEQAAVLSQISAGREADVTQIGDSLTKVLNGFLLMVPAHMVNEIRTTPGVKTVSKAPEYQINLDVSVPVINADDVWSEYDATGDGVTIAVIDTGIDYTHGTFGGVGTVEAYDTNDPNTIEAGTFPTAKVIGGYDFAGTDYTGRNVPVPDDDPLDEAGHGTHVASIAAGMGTLDVSSGVAPDALLYAVKIFGADGGTRLTLLGIEWAMDPLGLGHLGEPVDVINMSLGSDWGPADENDPEYIAVENAVSIGVVVVASAGNAGDYSYIVGSPSVCDSAISVAASSVLPYLEYGEGQRISYTTSDNAFTETITATLVDITTVVDDPSGELCTIPGGTDPDALLGNIALISRGTCNFSTKINNAETLGAVAAVIYNNTTGTIAMDTSGSTLPAGSILMADGMTLSGLAPLTVSIGPDSILDLTSYYLGGFSSRGPRGFDSKLKPEISAPGVAIYAAAMGSGDLGVAMNGTSMAAPHVAGVAALLIQEHPEWDPTHVKAAMMDTAEPISGEAAGVVPLIGSGQVNALEALDSPLIAYADPKLISLSWGLIEIGDDYSDTKRITLKNVSDVDIWVDVSTVFTSPTSDGASLTPLETSVIVPANGVTSVDVQLDLVAADMIMDQDAMNMEEYYGYVLLDVNGDAFTNQLPFYFVPRTYGELTETDSVTEFEVNTEFGWVDLDQSGPMYSYMWAYPVTLVSDNDPNVLDSGDLRYVGMDYFGYESGIGNLIVPAFAMWGGVHTNLHYFTEVDLYIDTPNGSVVDFNYDFDIATGGDGMNDWVVLQVDFADGTVSLASPYSVFTDFNSGFQEWYLPTSWNYIINGKFDYEVVSNDWYGNTDYAGPARFNAWDYPLNFDVPSFAWDQATGFAFEVNSWSGFRYSDIKGVMLVDYMGQPGVGQAYYWPISVHQNSLLPIFLY